MSSLEALFASPKGGPNPLQQLVNHYWQAQSMRSVLASYPQGSGGYNISTKLDSTRGLIEELEKLVREDSKAKAELASIDLTEANETYERLVSSDKEVEAFLKALRDFEFEKVWSKEQENSEIAKKFVEEFLALEEAYNQPFLPLSPVSMEKISDNTSDEEASSNKRQKTEQDKLEEVFSASEDQDQKFVDAYLQGGIDTSDVPIIPQRVVDISITEHDISVLNECIKKRDLTFIQQFAVKNDLTREEAYSLLLTQAMANHDFPHKTMKELFEFIEPDLTIFNKQNGYSFISALLTFGTREGTLYLKEYINTYEWNGKIELDTSDQHAIHNTLLISNALEVTEYEYVEFVTNLLGEICTTESINAALL